MNAEFNALVRDLTVYQTEPRREAILAGLDKTTLERLEAHFMGYDWSMSPDGERNTRLIRERLKTIYREQRIAAQHRAFLLFFWLLQDRPELMEEERQNRTTLVCANHPTAPAFMRDGESPLCEECCYDRWPRLQPALRAQQLILGGLPV